MSQASRQCIHELKALFHRWEEESDLEQDDILDCTKDALNEYYDEDVIEFESDIDEEEEWISISPRNKTRVGNKWSYAWPRNGMNWKLITRNSVRRT
jgi:hypothetical protein